MFGLRKEEVLDINEVIQTRDKGSILLDVREPDEYEEGHIPDSINISVDTIGKTELKFDKDSCIYVYCQTGMRAMRAVRILKKLGYTNTKNIGGILSYRGEVEKG